MKIKDKKIKERDILLGLFSSAGVFWMISNLENLFYLLIGYYFPTSFNKFFIIPIELILFLSIGFLLFKRMSLSNFFRKTFIITYLILLCLRIVYHLIVFF